MKAFLIDEDGEIMTTHEEINQDFFSILEFAKPGGALSFISLQEDNIFNSAQMLALKEELSVLNLSDDNAKHAATLVKLIDEAVSDDYVYLKLEVD